MTREEKKEIVSNIVELLNEYPHLYVVDVESLNAEKTANLRKLCFESDIKMMVVKNTLFIKALETSSIEDTEIFSTLTGNSAIFFSKVGNAPAKLIKTFRESSDKPVIKSALVESCLYIGDDKLDTLVNIKSKDELLADIIALLQSPMKNVISALSSSGHKLAGIVKTLESRNN